MNYQTEGETQGPSVETLIGQLRTDGTADAGTDPDDDPAAEAAALVAETASALYDEDALDIDDGLMKESLPELLVLLVGLRESDTHGKGLMNDIDRFFGTRLSPGTVYPRLHELDEEGLFEVHELVRTKEYHIADEKRVRERIEGAMRQHLALAAVLQNGLGRI
jgi:hypothetical protein